MRRLFSREFLTIFIPAVLIAAAAFWFAFRYVKPAPPDRFVLSAASKASPYYQLALEWQKLVNTKKNGVTLEIRESEGSFANLSSLLDPNSDVQAGIIQGGITDKTGSETLFSMGRLLVEPVWVFYRGEEKLERLTELKGKRILIGPAGSGTEFLAKKLLAANGIGPENATLISKPLPDYPDSFTSGAADAGFLVLGAEARTVQRLFYTPGVNLMNMAQAESLMQRFPFLSRVTLRQGVVNFAKNIPPEDTTLVATRAALVVRDDLHPALVNLLAQAVLTVQSRPQLAETGEAKLFPLSSDALFADDPEFPVSTEARRVYKNGPTFLQRLLPFWVATFLDRVIVLILPLIGIILPLVRLVPLVYNWRIRSRILYWYRELKNLERDLPASLEPEFIEKKSQDLDRIEEGVRRLSVPIQYQAELYNLRDHVDFVRRRIIQARGNVRGAPEPAFAG